MSALSNWPEGHRAPDADARGGAAPTIEEHAMSLQLYRSGMLSLTRLQLALERGDRPRAMEAIDDLHALDVEIERVIAALPLASDEVRQGRIGRSVRQGKMAVAFEKLALAGGISGPDLASPPALPGRRPAPDAAEREPAVAAEWPPAESRGARLLRDYAPRAVLLLAIVAATCAILLLAL